MEASCPKVEPLRLWFRKGVEPVTAGDDYKTTDGGICMKHGYLIDMDGVIYRGHELIPGADRFVQQLRTREIRFCFLTNNSQRTRRDVVTKLARMGVDVEEDHIFTCAMATARFLALQKPGGTAFVIGEGGLLNALHQNGFAIVDHAPADVVVGQGQTFRLDMLKGDVRMIQDGDKRRPTNLH